METGTFGDVNKFKTLGYICDKLSMMERNKVNYVAKVINTLNTVLVKAETIEDKDLRQYFLELLRKEYIERFQKMEGKFETDFHTHFKNFVLTKIKLAKGVSYTNAQIKTRLLKERPELVGLTRKELDKIVRAERRQINNEE